MDPRATHRLRLPELYRRAHPERFTCPKCCQSLGVRVVRTPCAAFPRGVAEAKPCGRCAQPSKPAHRSDRPAYTENRLSGLHRRIRVELGLAGEGFLPEQWVGPYRCDEVNYARKLVVEVNGDYVHANPALYDPDAWFVLGVQRFTARARWEEDAKRLAVLTSRGYRVLVVWESTPAAERFRRLEAFLAESSAG
jgi:very-short-patch-repair endonuclease